jgi:hypothetical protein
MTDVIIDYTNWRGERRTRRITPMNVCFDVNEYHPKPQWLLHAHDVAKDELRVFALSGIHHWEGPLDVLRPCFHPIATVPHEHNDTNTRPVQEDH